MGMYFISKPSAELGPAELLIRVQQNESIVIGEGTYREVRYDWDLRKTSVSTKQQQDIKNWKCVHTWAERRLRCHFRCEVEWTQYKLIDHSSREVAVIRERLERWLLTAEKSLTLSLSNGEFPSQEQSIFRGSAPIQHLSRLPLCYVALRRALLQGPKHSAEFELVLNRVTEWLFDALSLADGMIKRHLIS